MKKAEMEEVIRGLQHDVEKLKAESQMRSPFAPTPSQPVTYGTCAMCGQPMTSLHNCWAKPQWQQPSTISYFHKAEQDWDRYRVQSLFGASA